MPQRRGRLLLAARLAQLLVPLLLALQGKGKAEGCLRFQAWPAFALSHVCFLQVADVQNSDRKHAPLPRLIPLPASCTGPLPSPPQQTAAAQSCSITVPTASQNFDLRFVSGPVVRTLTVRRVPVTQRTYCFDIARNAKRGPGAGAVCDDTASPCCNAALIKPGKIYLRTSERREPGTRSKGAARARAPSLLADWGPRACI